MGRYAGFSNKTNNLVGGAGRRLKVFDFIVGCDAAPADQASKFAFRRTSAAGSQSAQVTPTKLDPADGAPIAVYDTAWSVDPTITASSDLLQMAMNQRATFRWIAAPNSELVVPAVSGAGLALMAAVATSPANHAFTLLWEE
jgi:hypothetical protein